MKNFLKYLGALIVLLGVVPLLIYHFGQTQSNVLLATAGVIMLVGAISHVVINKTAK
ncbi:MAG TPA: hypothetical protein P5084_03780 [Paludibacter sp.]|nr:hypothetical protein [Paludibacter sp.]